MSLVFLRPLTLLSAVVFVLALLVPSTAAASSDTQANAIKQAKPGPWGRIEYQTIYLAAPEEILNEFPMPNPQPHWCFADGTAASTRAFLSGAGLDAATLERLLADPRSRRDIEASFSVFPTVAEVAALKPAVRDTIYRELAKSPQNSFHAEPVCIPDGNIDEWLRGTGLPENIVALIRQLAWRDGDSLLFSDFSVLLAHASGDGEARRWIKTITRTRAIIAYLRVDDTDDLPTLRRYWSANYHRKDTLPFLNAAAAPEIGRIDLLHLLPPLPRRLAYSYTTPELDRIGQIPNCHWTSLNFFNYTRQNVYIDLKLAASQVLEDYDRIPSPYTFGDVLFFLDKQGNAFHSCIYLADNLVFTKNGGNTVVPWIITRLEDVKQLYLHDKPDSTIQGFRRRWADESN